MRGAEVRALVVDVTDPDAVERAADAAVEHFGKLHVAVNNAGIVVQGQLLGAAALGMAPCDRRRPVGRDPRDPRVRAPHPRVGRAGIRGEHRVDGGGHRDPGHRALHRVEARGARHLRRLARRARGDRRTGRRERGDAGHDQDRAEPVRHGRSPSRWRPTCVDAMRRGRAVRVHRRPPHPGGRVAPAGDHGVARADVVS